MDLSAGYRELPPPAGLRDLVACTWVRVAGDGDPVRVLPDGCTDLLWRRGAGVVVAGPDTTAQLTALEPGDVVVGLRFAPGAGGAALGLPLDEVRDLRVDATDVSKAFAIEPDEEPERALQRLLAAVAGREADVLVAEAARRLVREDVTAVARDVALSPRQMRRRFHAAVGYGPKTLARVLRFQRFVRDLDAGADDLGRLAIDCGYADQAHLTRECTELAGLPPAAFRRSRAAARPA